MRYMHFVSRCCVLVGLSLALAGPSWARPADDSVAASSNGAIAAARDSAHASAASGQPNAVRRTLMLPLVTRAGVYQSDWPQVQGNAAHTGYSGETLGTNMRVVWTHAFQPEKVAPQVQAIVAGGRVYVGTEMGQVYALEARTGATLWRASVGGPVLNSVAVDGGRVYVSSLDGAVSALEAASGNLLWRAALSWRVGFSTAPVVVNGRLYIGGRNGVLYCLEGTSGAVLWQRDLQTPLLQTAAADGERVYVGGMDLRVYALRQTDGTLAWTTGVLPQMAFKDYWPVVTAGRVIVRPLGPGSLPSADLSAAAQAAALAAYDAQPAAYRKSLYVFEATSGRELPGVIHWDTQTMNGATPPPCVDYAGQLIVPAPRPDGTYGSGWGRLDLNTRQISGLLTDGTGAGFGNVDETLLVTCTANGVLALHTEEGNANYTGFYAQTSGRWYHLEAGMQNKQLSSNTQGGGGNPAAVANGYVYHLSWHELVVRATQ